MFQPNPPRRLLSLAALAMAIAALHSTSNSQTVARASVSSQGAQANDRSEYSSISADGRVVVFDSYASNLVPNDTNGARDVFVRDLVSGTTERVSVGPGGLQGNGDSISFASPSADGRYVVFYSAASNLVPNDTNGATSIMGYDAFVHDRQTGATEIVSVSSAGEHGNGDNAAPSISEDGRFVAFGGSSSNLVAGDANGFSDMFVRDRQLGTTERVSIGLQGEANGNTWYGRISTDGRYVGYESLASNLVLSDTNGVQDAFVYDRTSATTTRVSQSLSGLQGNAMSRSAVVSADGRFAAFDSNASNLVGTGGDTNGISDVFVKNLQTGTVELATVNSAGVQQNGSGSRDPDISADGRFVGFESTATNLAPGDVNGNFGGLDVFRRDRLTHTTECVSVHSDGRRIARGQNGWPSMSSDGRVFTFESDATTLVVPDTNATVDVFVRDAGLPPTSFCHDTACPCVNGANGHGCGHSASVMGALLSADGQSSLFADQLSLTASNQVPDALSILMQGSAQVPAVNYGDGLRCVGGSLKRLYAHAAGGTATSYPGAGDAPVAARSAALGDTIAPGSTRYYQGHFRDASPSYCPPPFGSTWNATNAVGILWTP